MKEEIIFRLMNNTPLSMTDREDILGLLSSHQQLEADYLALKQSAELSISQLNGEKEGLEIKYEKLREAFESVLDEVWPLDHDFTDPMQLELFKDRRNIWITIADITDREDK